MGLDKVACGKRIKELRIQHGLTQYQLADQLGIFEKHVSKLELGQHRGSIDLMIQISEFFGVALDYLLLGKKYHADEFNSEYMDILDKMLQLKNKL